MLDKDALLVTDVYSQPYQKEKDYIEELFLSGLYGGRAGLAFKGGTALAKFYGSARFSDDLDFSVDMHDGINLLPKRINDVVDMVSSTYRTKVLRRNDTADILTYELSIMGPLYSMSNRYQHLKIDIDKKARIYERTQTFRRNPVYADLKPYVAMVLNGREILAEKAMALLFRPNPKARDLYDLYFLIDRGVEVKTSLIDQKIREHGHGFGDVNLERKMARISSIWDKELVRLLPEDRFIAYARAAKVVADAFKNAGLI